MVGHIWREWYVVSCMSIQHLATGMVYSFPAILTPAITSNSSDISATREEASWITSSFSLLGPFSYLILSYVMQTYGRKYNNILMNMFLLIGSITVALASDVTYLLVGRGIQGLSYAGGILTGVTIAEYSHPKRRPIFIIIKVLNILIGVVVCHCLNGVLKWRQVAWITTVPSVFGLLSTFTWPESPSWLVYVGRFENSVEAFEWLRGKDPESRKEIRELIVAQRDVCSRKINRNIARRIIKSFSSKKFLKPLGIAVALIFLAQASGTFYLLAYVIEIMEKVTGNKYEAYYYTMGFDMVKILGILTSAVTIKFLNRRTILLYFGGLASLLLGLFCVMDYFHENGKFVLTWLIPLTLIVYNYVCHMAIVPILAVLKGEIYPLKYKGIGLTVSGIFNSIVTTVTVKITSNMLVSLKIYGTFAVFLVIVLISLITLYFILPETKDRTLQDIETEFDSKERKKKIVDSNDVAVASVEFISCK